MGLQDYLSSGRLQLTCACRGELPPYGCWWGDGGEAPRAGCGIFGGRGKLKIAGTQALGREAEEEEAGPSGEGPGLAESWTTRSQWRFLSRSTPGSGKTVLEGVQRPDQTGKKTETHWGMAGMSQAMRQARAQDLVRRSWAQPHLCHLPYDPRYVT